MKFTLEFNMDNDAFTQEYGDQAIDYAEVRRILETVARKTETQDSGSIRDTNGHTVGKWEITA